MKRALTVSGIIFALIIGLGWVAQSDTANAKGQGKVCKKFNKNLRKAVKAKRSAIFRETALKDKFDKAREKSQRKYNAYMKAKKTYAKFVRTHHKAIIQGKPGALKKQRKLDRKMGQAYRDSMKAGKEALKIARKANRAAEQAADAKKDVQSWNQAKKRAGCR